MVSTDLQIIRQRNITQTGSTNGDDVFADLDLVGRTVAVFQNSQ